jgi:hypothetical protein
MKYCRVKKDINILHGIKQRKANWIGHTLRRNSLLKHVVEDKRKDEMSGKTRKKMESAT